MYLQLFLLLLALVLLGVSLHSRSTPPSPVSTSHAPAHQIEPLDLEVFPLPIVYNPDLHP